MTVALASLWWHCRFVHVNVGDPCSFGRMNVPVPSVIQMAGVTGSRSVLQITHVVECTVLERVLVERYHASSVFVPVEGAVDGRDP